jgi:thymidylate synthase ThyX
MDSHAQLEIRSFANCMFEIVQQVCPVACEAFEDYVLHAKRFSRMEMEVIRELFVRYTDSVPDFSEYDKPSSMTDREWKEFVGKLS